jgi:hypothetical protein
MGGWRWGSGRPRTRASVEQYRVFDIGELDRDHLSSTDQTWIMVQVRDADGNWQTVQQFIHIARRPRHFGGAQAYFRCSRCDRAALKLCQPGCGFYRCRRCLRLAYPSEREDAVGRAFRAAGKIKGRLGRDPDYFAPFPPKPRDMRWRTYERRWHEYLEAEKRAEAAFDMPAEAMTRWGVNQTLDTGRLRVESGS